MNADRLLHVVSGALFLLAGIALTLNVEVPIKIKIDSRILFGTILIVIGISIALGASFGSAVVFGISILTLLLSLSSFQWNMTFQFTETREVGANLTNCEGLSIEGVASSLTLRSGNSTAYFGAVSSELISQKGCKLTLCCSQLTLDLGEVKALYLKPFMSSVEGQLNNCIREMGIKSVMSDVRLEVNVPPGCNATLRLKSVMGSARVKLVIPKGTRVVYNVSSSLGEASVRTPEGVSGSGSYGEGENVVRVSGKAIMGDLKILIENSR